METAAARAWLDRWDVQQERYVPDREERFRVVIDVVAAAVAGVARPRIVDLGCGPGSLATRLAAALPHAEIVGIDADPLLLDLAASAGGSGVRFVRGLLNEPGWDSCLDGPWDAVVSSTALHWLEHSQLADVFATAAERLRPGGVLVNADNMHLPEPLREYGNLVRKARAARVGVTDNEDWRAWWEAILADVDDETAREHSALAISHDSSSDLTVDQYTELLRKAGFTAAGPVWQFGDDHVLVAVR
ncbi:MULTISPECIES: class I SAM-dependent methyltransferase [Actinokineospora]|uniref:Methyltransferase n=1 Tax=Actinokineospora fastidiosa TaxID=1816 RepID=A0A918LID0_9PSEU|nr:MULTISPECIES: class I SAM-dependent methyltransferase [Actinokineospora]UVS81224.1 trans-aconitate 2-methyltransferase [Actinokineospora sp. UTMC 2448]GGS52181.1 methyltransferase [Actinokineospora fastidiosa]